VSITLLLIFAAVSILAVFIRQPYPIGFKVLVDLLLCQALFVVHLDGLHRQVKIGGLWSSGHSMVGVQFQVV
jgi:hypothetical protein